MLNKKKYDYSNIKSRTMVFDSGVCTIWTANERTLSTQKGSFNFYDESVSGKAFWDAYVNNVGVDRSISIPQSSISITTQDVVKIGTTYYQISRLQYHDNGSPEYVTLSLSESKFAYSGGN